MRCLGPLCERAEHDSLVIRPGGLSIVMALPCACINGQPIVYEIVAVDHPGVLEPLPLSPGPIRVLLLFSRCAGT